MAEYKTTKPAGCSRLAEFLTRAVERRSDSFPSGTGRDINSRKRARDNQTVSADDRLRGTMVP